VTAPVVRGVGAVAAEMVAQAAELVAVLARQAGHSARAADARSISARASGLSVSNEIAFVRASRELHGARAGRGDESDLAHALANAADVPLRVCEIASELVLLACGLATGPLSSCAADLAGVAQLADGACSAAALLVSANSVLDVEDPRRARAHATAAAATAASRRLIAQLTAAKPRTSEG
jgi:hypothetical protein